MSEPQTIKPFHRQGWYIPLDVSLIRELMPTIGANAWRIICVVLDHEKGQETPPSEGLPYTELMRRSGIRSPETISRCLDEVAAEDGTKPLLKAPGIFGPGAAPSAASYRLNRDFELCVHNVDNHVEKYVDT